MSKIRGGLLFVLLVCAVPVAGYADDVKVIPYTEFPGSTLNRQTSTEMTNTLEAMRVAILEKGCDAVITAEGG